MIEYILPPGGVVKIIFQTLHPPHREALTSLTISFLAISSKGVIFVNETNKS